MDIDCEKGFSTNWVVWKYTLFYSFCELEVLVQSNGSFDKSFSKLTIKVLSRDMWDLSSLLAWP